MTDILEGVRVIEMGHVVCVPAATSMMGDCGADVIKIEPMTGDQSRTFRGTEVNPGFYLHNRSKRSIAIDLRQQAGKDIVYKMVGEHDVFLTNYQAGSLQRLGLDYETLCGIKANIIYGIVSAYGTVGPDKDMAGYDFAAGWARSGIQDMLSIPGMQPPASRPGIIDRVSSMQVFGGICAALYHREHTGEGQKVEFNLYHTGVWMVGADIMDALFGPAAPARRSQCVGQPVLRRVRVQGRPLAAAHRRRPVRQGSRPGRRQVLAVVLPRPRPSRPRRRPALRDHRHAPAAQ